VLPALTVVDQAISGINGDSIVIATAYSNVASWIVVHDDANGSAVVATVALAADTKQIDLGVVLSAIPATGVTSNYTVMFHTDTDTNDGAFNSTVDTPVTAGVNTVTIAVTGVP